MPKSSRRHGKALLGAAAVAVLGSTGVAAAAPPTPYYASFHPSSPRTSTATAFYFYAEGGPVKGGWDFAGGDAFALTSEGFESTHTFATDGLHSITYAAENAQGERGVGRLQMATHPDNWAPIVQVYDEAVPTNQPFGVSFDAYDDSPHAGLKYSYDLDNDGTFNEAGQDGTVEDAQYPWSVTHTFTTDGAHPIKVKVEDGQGESVVGSATITTHTANKAPVVAIDGPDPAEVLVGEGYQLHADYRDDYTGRSSATYEWTVDGVVQEDSTSYYVVVGPWDSPGSHEVKVKVTDTGRQPGGENPLSSEATFTIKAVEQLTPATPVEPQLGVHSYTTPHGATPSFRTLENVSLSAYVPSVTDPAYAWDLDNDGAFDDASGYVAYFAAPNKGSYKVSVQATGSKAGEAPVVLSRTVVIDAGKDYAPSPTTNTGGGGGGTTPPAITAEQAKAAMVAFLSRETLEFLQSVSGQNRKGIDAGKAVLVLGTLDAEELPNGGTGDFKVYDKAGSKKLVARAAAAKRKLLGSTKVTLAKGQSKKVQVKLNKRGKALLKKKGKVKLTVDATLTDALTGAQVKRSKTYTFKVKKSKKRR